MTIDPGAARKHLGTTTVVADLQSRDPDAALTGREPGATKRFEALQSPMGPYTPTTRKPAITITDGVVEDHVAAGDPECDENTRYDLTAAGLAALNAAQEPAQDRGARR